MDKIKTNGCNGLVTNRKLTAWNTALLEKLIVVLLVKKLMD
jgi:hypothetical protein